MKTFKIISLIIIIAIISAVVAVGYFVNQFFFISSADWEEDQVFNIEFGEGVNQISYNLKDRGLINNMFIFETYVWLIGSGGNFKAGNFSLSPGMSMMSITSILTLSGVESDVEVTILEGWTNREIGEYLESIGITTVEEWYAVVGDPALDLSASPGAREPVDFSAEFDFLADKPASVSLEGYLFPDTYRVFADATAEDIARRMLDNFSKKFSLELRRAAANQGKTIFEVVTMASVIEREARTSDSRRMVSDIFWRRLDIGMPLQACSTVNYITGKSDPAVTLVDRDIESPFNTYQNAGLPLGPIANPSLDSIQAALEPTANDYLYFLTTPEGEMIYSATNDEHVANKQKYLK